MYGFAMFMSFSSFLTHPTGQCYDTQQLRGGGGHQYDTPVNFKYDISLKSVFQKQEIPGKCHCGFLHN